MLDKAVKMRYNKLHINCEEKGFSVFCDREARFFAFAICDLLRKNQKENV